MRVVIAICLWVLAGVQYVSTIQRECPDSSLDNMTAMTGFMLLGPVGPILVMVAEKAHPPGAPTPSSIKCRGSAP